MDLQDFLESPTLDPPYNGSITIGVHGGRGFEHCYSGYAFAPGGGGSGGDLPLPNAITRLTYLQRFLPLMARRFAETAPAAASMEWHRY